MPVIPPPARRMPQVTLSTRMDAELRDLLDEYCVFASCGRKHVVAESLRRTFQQDREFQRWLAERSRAARTSEGSAQQKALAARGNASLS